jgi:hypothetical protein
MKPKKSKTKRACPTRLPGCKGNCTHAFGPARLSALFRI